MRARERRSGARQLASRDLWAPKAASQIGSMQGHALESMKASIFRDWMIRNVPANSLDAPTQ